MQLGLIFLNETYNAYMHNIESTYFLLKENRF